jgi:hypothetical protein
MLKFAVTGTVLALSFTLTQCLGLDGLFVCPDGPKLRLGPCISIPDTWQAPKSAEPLCILICQPDRLFRVAQYCGIFGGVYDRNDDGSEGGPRCNAPTLDT